MQSYYGGLLCCAWSPDGQFIAAGGEDDLVALYSLEARCCVAWGAGHHSWVAGVAFDTWCARICNSIYSSAC
jgi:WD repeat-containing protein 20